jgi:uroporphyrinogen-III synthase
MLDPDLPLLLLTRPRPQSERFAAKARIACPPHRTLVAPLTEIVRLPMDAPLREGESLIFTSANGVEAVADLPGHKGRQAWCVGPATAAAARTAGFSVREAGGDAAHLLADLRAARPQEPLVHIRGRHIACDLTTTLGAEGLEIRAAVAYEARMVPWDAKVLSALCAAGRVVTPLFSPRAAAEFARRLNTTSLPNLHLVAISPACAARLPETRRAAVTITESPDGEAMLRATAAALAPVQSMP